MEGLLLNASPADRVRTFPRRVLVVSVALMALGCAVAALAWACSPQALINVTSPGPGGSATVTGSQFADGRVEVRLDAAGGPLLATVAGPSFSVGISVEAPGAHNIVAIGHRADGSVAGRAVASFEVAPEPSASPEPGGAGGPSAGGPAAPASGTTPSDRQPSRAAPPSRVAPRKRAVDESRPGAGPGRGKQAGAPVAAGAPRRGRSAAIRTRSGTLVFGDSLGSPGRSRSARSKGAQPTQRTAFGEISGGFAPATDSIATARGSGETLSVGRVGPQLAVGLGLLGAGLVALFGGFLAAAARRRLAHGAGRTPPD